MPTQAGSRARVIFDELTFESDLRRASATGRAVAGATRAAYDREGCPVEELHACEAEGADGSRLPRCVKVYLPAPAGRFGMVFEIDRQKGKLVLAYLAFGVRHHPRDSNAPTVYLIAHERLSRRPAAPAHAPSPAQ